MLESITRQGLAIGQDTLFTTTSRIACVLDLVSSGMVSTAAGVSLDLLFEFGHALGVKHDMYSNADSRGDMPARKLSGKISIVGLSAKNIRP